MIGCRDPHRSGEEARRRGATPTARCAADSHELLCQEEQHRAARLHTALQNVCVCVAIHLRKSPQGHIEECRERIIGLLRQRPETKRRVEHEEDMQDVKLARYVEQQDQQHQPIVPANAAPSRCDETTAAGEASGSGGRTSASGSATSGNTGSAVRANLMAGRSSDPQASSGQLIPAGSVSEGVRASRGASPDDSEARGAKRARREPQERQGEAMGGLVQCSHDDREPRPTTHIHIVRHE